MKSASDYRRISRESLRGKWPLAVIAGLVALLLGGTATNSNSINFNINLDNGIEETVIDPFFSGGGSAVLAGIVASIFTVALVTALISLVIRLVLGSVISLGYAKFNLRLVDRAEETKLGDLFSYFGYWVNALCAELLRSLYVFLWSLLFVIPGIVATYSYSMTSYILAEHPELSAREALACSKDMMRGHRWSLFCLQLSFIGWEILSAFTFGIGTLFLTPYRNTAVAAFYRDLTREAPSNSPEF